MRFSDQFLDEIRQRLPITQVVGEHVIWDKRKSQPGRGDYLGLLPVPRREERRAFTPTTARASTTASAAG